MSMQSCKQLNIKLWKQSVNVPLGPENWFLFLTSHPSKDQTYALRSLSMSVLQNMLYYSKPLRGGSDKFRRRYDFLK